MPHGNTGTWRLELACDEVARGVAAMLFNSSEFIFLFLPVTIFGFFFFAKIARTRVSVLWLVIASLFYYGWWNPAYVILVGGSMAFNFALGQNIVALNRRDADTLARWITGGGIVANLALLGYFKYAEFFLDTVNAAAGTGWTIGEIILPIGISFFTFQQIAYLVDALKGEADEYDFVDYALFVLFFPQLIAGPIVHHKEMMPQFAAEDTFQPSWQNLTVGFTIFVFGLFKKVVLADNLAIYASPVFDAADAGEPVPMVAAWLGAFAYGFQLYFDFSGYSDMAIGIARMFGVRLPLNFDSPYKATSIIDFWRRWHITLSRFLQEYVYIALGGNRRGRVRRYANLMITMLLGGLWHGSSWNFVLWGALHGVFLMINHASRALFGPPGSGPIAIWTGRALTLLAAILAWVPFRAVTWDGAVTIYAAMLSVPSFEDLPPDLDNAAIWVLIGLAICWLLPNTQQVMARFEPAYRYGLERAQRDGLPWLLRTMSGAFWQPNLRWSMATGFLFALAVMSLNRISEFLYFQF